MATSNIVLSSGDGASLSSPQSRRRISSPWTQIVRGESGTQIVRGESESVVSAAAAVAPSSPSASVAVTSDSIARSSPPAPATSHSSPAAEDDSAAEAAQTEGSDSAAKKQVWGKPSNGNGNNGQAVEVSPVMDAASWPALSACTKAYPKSSSSDSLKALSDGSLLPSQGSGVASSSSNKPVIANNANPNSTPNHGTTTRQRSFKRGGGSSANGGFIQPPAPPQPQGPSLDIPPGKQSNTAGESLPHKDGGGQRGGFGNDHQPQRSNSFNRRGGGGNHPRGDGSYHHGYMGRRDQDRGNQDWNNAHRNFGSRDNHMQPQRVVPRGFRPPAPAFIPPPVPLRPFGNPMVYPEVPQPLIYMPGPPPDSLRGIPIVAPMPTHPLYFPPVLDPQLHAKIVNQIDYYFSNDNLIKDTYLRQNMDEQGWVPIKLIAGFKKVMLLTDNIQLILNAVQASTVVEVQNDKVRKRNEWMKWIMPPGPFSPVSSSQSLARPSHDMLAGQFQGVALDENTEMFGRSSSGEFSSQLQQQSGGEGTTAQAGPSK